MGLAIIATFAACLWVVLSAFGFKPFDGFMIGLVLVLVAAGSRALVGALPGIRRGD